MRLHPKNYHAEGGDKWIVEGELEFGPDAKVTNLPSGSETVTWDEVQGKPTEFPAANIGEVGGPVGPVVAEGKVVYGNNQGGQYTIVAYNESPSPFSLVMRDFDGNFTVHDPTDDAHPASKGYVDGAVAGKADTASLATVATTGAYGDLDGAPQGVAVADADDETAVLAQLNALLDSLRGAGLIAS